MKKTLLLCLLAPFALNAQRYLQEFYQLNTINYDYNTFFDDAFAPPAIRKDLQIKEVKSTYTNHKGKKTETTMTFNAMGKTLSKVNRHYTTTYRYESDTLPVQIINSWKKKVYTTNTTYVQGRIATSEYLKNNKRLSRTVVEYNAAGKITRSKTTKGRKTYTITNNYTEDNKLQETVFRINDKVKKTWKYDCKPEGEVVAAKTDMLSSSCTYQEESADGSYTVYTRTLYDGKPYLFKESYTRDSVRVLSQRFLKDSLLIWEIRTENGVETISHYKPSGKKSHKQVTVRNAQGRRLSREYFTGKNDKPMSGDTYELNADGTTKSVRSSYRGKPRTETNYLYVNGQQ